MDFINNFSNLHLLVTIIVCIVWELIWKGFALWRAAKNNHIVWFICIIFFNTLGVLPIIYLFSNRTRKMQ
ncbi:MAG: DUF5652 family protein [Bacteroidales bacterium]|jgi:hypothetical protein|nr:DUF5652 family protein [Bacteroidales bacterium]